MINIAKTAGFCGGVSTSINKTKEYLNTYKNLYCLGELVHNKEVVTSLTNNGLKVVNSLDEVEDNSNVILRAHGVPKKVYEEAANRNINLLDLTCPKVLKIHKEIKEYSDNNYFVILIGSKTHPETIGSISYANNGYVIEDESDIEECINKINTKDIVIFSQTTYSKEKFNKITSILKDKLQDKNLIINNTICNATSIRQDECMKMSKENDCMIIIGGKNSSNTKKLYDISSSNCKNTYLIETVKDLDINKITNFNNIGIMAGASTPKESIDEVVNAINKTTK